MSNAMKQAIAATAARWVVEEGLAYGPAKQKAVREMGLSSRQALPDNDMLEAEVLAYLQNPGRQAQPVGPRQH